MSSDVARESVRGSLALLLGSLVSTVFSAGAIIYTARLLGPDGYGTYTLVLVLPGILQLFMGFGVNSAATRYSAYYLSRGMQEKAVQITRSSIVILLLFGVGLSAVNFVAGPYLAGLFLHRSDLGAYVRLASLWILGGALAQASTSALIGWGSMGNASLSSAIQGMIKLVASVSLIFLGFGVYGAIIGQVSSFLVEGAFATVAIFLAMRQVGPLYWSGTFAHLREMFSYGIPIFTGGIAGGLASQFLTVVLASIASNSMVGFYQAGLNVTVLVSLMSDAVGHSLFRSFATLDGLKADLSAAYRYAVHYVSFALSPVVFFLAASSGVLYGLIYGQFYASHSIILTLIMVSYFPVAVGFTVIPSFLNGVGRSGLSMFTTLASASALAIAGPVLAIWFNLGVVGIIYALLVSNIASVALGLFFSRKYLNARLDVMPLVGIIAACLVAWFAVFLIPQASIGQVAALAIDLLVFMVVYFTTVPFFRGIRREDLARLEVASHGMGALGRIVRIILSYEGRLLRVTR